MPVSIRHTKKDEKKLYAVIEAPMVITEAHFKFIEDRLGSKELELVPSSNGKSVMVFGRGLVDDSAVVDRFED